MRAGVDEAGRGPVLGSLVVACVHANPHHLPKGIADSKTLTPTTRKTLHEALHADPRITIATRTITAEGINQAHRQGRTLNQLEEDAFTHLLEHVDARQATVDTIGPNPQRFQARLNHRLPTCHVTAKARADETDPIVAAASIIAKHERDTCMQRLEQDQGQALGSGYPNDPTTRAFLTAWRENDPHPPPFAREAWSTLTDLGFNNHTLTEYSRNQP